MAYSNIDASLRRIRTKKAALTSYMLNEKSDFSSSSASKEEMRLFADKAAEMCTPRCREMIAQNMQAKGLKSKAISQGVSKGIVKYGDKKGVIIFMMPAGLPKRPNDNRQDAVYKQAASLNYGWFIGGAHISKRGKQLMKKAIAKEGNSQAFSEKHFERGVGWITKEAKSVNTGGPKFVAGKFFFQFTSTQQVELKRLFRSYLAKLLTQRGHAALPAKANA